MLTQCTIINYMIPAVYNTKKSGVLHFIIYKERSEYAAACLNFDLVEYGKNPEKLKKSIYEAATSYLKAVRKKKLSDKYLNLPVDKKYLDILEKISIDKLFRKLATKKRYRHQELSTFSFTNQPYSDNSLSYL